MQSEHKPNTKGNYDDIKHFLGGHTTRVAKKSIPIKDCTEKKYGVLPKGLLLKNIYYLHTGVVLGTEGVFMFGYNTMEAT